MKTSSLEEVRLAMETYYEEVCLAGPSGACRTGSWAVVESKCKWNVQDKFLVLYQHLSLVAGFHSCSHSSSCMYWKKCLFNKLGVLMKKGK